MNDATLRQLESLRRWAVCVCSIVENQGPLPEGEDHHEHEPWCDRRTYWDFKQALEDLELLRSFLWDDDHHTMPEDVHAVLHRAMDRLVAS